MQETWRWFGPTDTVTLEQIRQAGATGVVTALDHIATGEIWPEEDIADRKQLINDSGLEWAVVESVPLHQDIKLRHGDYQRLIENYCRTLANLGKFGITRVCYNFMPVVDWTRTNLNFELDNASSALRFEMADFVAYDVYILQRPNAAADYNNLQLQHAESRFIGMSEQDKVDLESNIIAGLPGGEGSYTRESISQAIEAFRDIGNTGLRANLLAFLEDIVPAAEVAGVVMAIHPDDPPIPLFGVPRVVSTLDDYDFILKSIRSQSNGMTFCSGSLGSNINNDVYKIFNKFKDKIHFIHLRNVKIEKDKKSFYESNHLNGDIDFVKLIKMITKEEKRRSKNKKVEIPMRPDHGHCLLDDQKKKTSNPGYTAIGRLMGLSELRGIVKAIKYETKTY